MLTNDASDATNEMIDAERHVTIDADRHETIDAADRHGSTRTDINERDGQDDQHERMTRPTRRTMRRMMRMNNARDGLQANERERWATGDGKERDGGDGRERWATGDGKERDGLRATAKREMGVTGNGEREREG
jgi:hypothetical protein